jgi:hypothetical protein
MFYVLAFILLTNGDMTQVISNKGHATELDCKIEIEYMLTQYESPAYGCIYIDGDLWR